MTRLPAIFATALLAFGLHAASAAEPEKTKLTIGVGSQILNYMPLELAAKRGAFKDQGLDVTVANFQAGGVKALQALMGGSVDGVVGFYDHTIAMQAQGKALTCVFLVNDVPGVLIGVRSDLADKVKSGADLKGLKLGITSPGSSTDMMGRAYVKQAGLGPRDVSVIAVSSGAPGIVALESKTIDALVYFDPSATLIEQRKLAVPLFDARTIEGSKKAFGGVYPTACLYFPQSFIDKNPETVQRMVNAFAITHRWITTVPTEELVDAIPPGYKTADRDTNITILNASKDLFSKDGAMSLENMKVPYDVLANYDPKVAATNIDLTKTFTNRFVDEAKKQVK